MRLEDKVHIIGVGFDTPTQANGERVFLAKCGHEDALSYFIGAPCGKCVRKAHRKAVGK